MAIRSKAKIGRAFLYLAYGAGLLLLLGVGLFMGLPSLGSKLDLLPEPVRLAATIISFLLFGTLIVVERGYRRKAVQNSELLTTVRNQTMSMARERMHHKSALQLGDVDVKLLKEASDLCDMRDYESAIKILAKCCEAAGALDYAALYLRGRTQVGRGFEQQALKDFDQALRCLKYYQGLIESARAESYISTDEVNCAKSAARASIRHMESSDRPVHWIPHLYLAIALGKDDKRAAEKALRDMMNIEFPADQSERAIAATFIGEHPLLKKIFKENSQLKIELDSWGLKQ